MAAPPPKKSRCDGVPLLDGLALRTISAVVHAGTDEQMAACMSCLTVLFHFLYGNEFVKVVGIASGYGAHRDARVHLSRYAFDAPRVFAVLRVSRGGRTEHADVMLTAPPERAIAAHHAPLETQLEVIDVRRAPLVRYYLWLGRQLSTRTGSDALLQVFIACVMPLVLDAADTCCGTPRLHRQPKRDVRQELV